MLKVVLPWPPAALRPNYSQRHWRGKHAAAQPYKLSCAWALKAQGIEPIPAERLHLTLRFCPPDKRRRDLDNMLAQFKYGIDAISDAVGVDDYFFSLTLMRAEPVKGGAVTVTITED